MSTNASTERHNPKPTKDKEPNLGQKEADQQKEEARKLGEMGERHRSVNEKNR